MLCLRCRLIIPLAAIALYAPSGFIKIRKKKKKKKNRRSCWGLFNLQNKDSGLDKHLSRRPTFPIGHAKMGGQFEIVSPIETKLEILLFVPHYLKRVCSFHFKCASIKIFGNDKIPFQLSYFYYAFSYIYVV